MALPCFWDTAWTCNHMTLSHPWCAVYACCGCAVQPLSPDAPPDVTVGLTVLGSRGLFTDQYWRWIGVGALIGFVILFNFLCILALQYLNRKWIGGSAAPCWDSPVDLQRNLPPATCSWSRGSKSAHGQGVNLNSRCLARSESN